ncbi:MAG: hypothetical protein LBJ18_03610 [Rickettsiales bacterium]|jgi:hypothetical protein|nr:hypothetical protein [Rickettsiales bacterium]
MVDFNKSSYWLQKISKYKNDKRVESFLDSGFQILRRLRNKKNSNALKFSWADISSCLSNTENIEDGYNLLFQVIKTISPFLISYIPDPIVDRRDREQNPVARMACEILERTISYNLDISDFKNAYFRARQDNLIFGRGVLWAEYSAENSQETVQESDPLTGAVIESTRDIVSDEKISLVYVAPSDFFHNEDARIPEEIKWYARRKFVSPDYIKSAFPGARVQESTASKKAKIIEVDDPKTGDDNIELFEIWNVADKKIYWVSPQVIAEDMESVLAAQDFYWDVPAPCQMLVLNETNDNIIPTSLLSQILPQQNEIDLLSSRITRLSKALKVKGAYDKSISEMGDFLSDANDTAMNPVDVIKYIDKGGIQNALYFMPLDTIKQALDYCKQARQDLIDLSLRNIQINPILEGQTNSNEAFGTNRIKGSFGIMSVQDMQRVCAEFLEACVKMQANIICQEFESYNIADYANMPFDAETAPALELLKSEKIRNTEICVEIESTKAYYDEVYQARIAAFMSTLQQDIQNAQQVIAGAPELADVFKLIILQKVRSQRIGRMFEAGLEKSLEELVAKVKQAAAQPAPPPQPDPTAMATIQAREAGSIQREQVRQTAENDRADKKMAIEAMNLEIKREDLRIKQASDRAKELLKNKELDAEIIANQERVAAGLIPDANLG